MMPRATRLLAAPRLHRQFASAAPGVTAAASTVPLSLQPGWQPPTAPTLSERPPAEWVGVYSELSKSRLSALVVSTTAAGYLMTVGPLDPICLASTLGGTFLCSASANTFNQLIETKNDAAMNRTAKRPLPSGRISHTHALGWASVAGVTGVGSLALGANCVTAGLGLTTLGLYTLVYTPMKQRTPLNTWVGAVVGAIPPVMGWTAGGGALLTPEAATLGAALFLWQMPHFFALSWMYRDDYAQGGYKMIPLHDPAGERTSALCLEYSLYLAALPPICWAAGLTSCMFAIESVAFNGALLLAAWRFHSNSSRGQAHARRLFLVSLGYLPLFFGCLLLHQRRQTHSATVEEDEEATLAHAAGSMDEPLERIRAKGRELCIHEQIVSGASGGIGGKHDDGSSAAPTADEAAARGRCPVALAEAAAGQVMSVGAHAANGTSSAPHQAQR